LCALDRIAQCWTRDRIDQNTGWAGSARRTPVDGVVWLTVRHVIGQRPGQEGGEPMSQAVDLPDICRELLLHLERNGGHTAVDTLPARFQDDDVLNILCHRNMISAGGYYFPGGGRCMILEPAGQAELALWRLRPASVGADSESPLSTWKPSPGMVGVKEIQFGDQYRKNGKGPARSVIGYWVKHHRPKRTEIDPASQERYYPEDWVRERWEAWSPSNR
jgi:hypothetical protein